MESTGQRDEWYMAQVALGKRDHLEPLVRRYASRLLTFIERLIGDRHRSEELFQEAFLAVWIKRRQYQFPRKFRSWLYAIAVNLCRLEYRRGRMGMVSLQGDLPGLDPTGSEREPGEAAVAVETAVVVAEAVTRLPQRQREVVVLRVWEGLSYGEIAAILHRSEPTVRSHMHHALASLRTYLEPRLRNNEP